YVTLNQNEAGTAHNRRMQTSDRSNHAPQTSGSGIASAEAELSFLRSVVGMLPSGVTVQDEQGRFLLMNDAAAAQLGLASGGAGTASAQHLDRRQATCREL